MHSCGNTSKGFNSAQQDSIKAEMDWNNTIPGGFSGQQSLVFDSMEIQHFLSRHPDFRSIDSNIQKFYKHRNYAFAWFDRQGLIEQAGNLVGRISNMKEEGLFTEPSYGVQLDSLLQDNGSEKRQVMPDVQLELMLTAQYFEFANKAWQGMDESISESSHWYLPRKKVTYEAFLDSLLKTSPDESAMLKEPVYRQYELLKSFLEKYRQLDEHTVWPVLEMDQKLYKEGDSSGFVSKVKARLSHLGDFMSDTSNMNFDKGLTKALERFQGRHGLAIDGTIGVNTLKELNVSPKSRIRQIIVNMERSRWLPLSLQEDYLAVNIPEFKLHVYHADSLLWSSRVVVGKSIHKTVVFSGDIKYVVFSPYWNVPSSIVKNEIMPAMSKDLDYLRRNHMEITGRQGGIPIIRQKPGPHNSLGLVKFLFPNSHNIYLHDSPAKSLFGQSSRAFSHGCIRVEEPVKLAQFLLKEELSWDESAILTAMNRGTEKWVTLKEEIPVFITYFTAFVDRDGNINFRQDIYERDERLARMLIEEK